MGTHVDAVALYHRMVAALAEGNEAFARFKSRCGRDRKIYRLSLPEGEFFAVLNERGIPITLLEPNAEVRRSAKSGKKRLQGFKEGRKRKWRRRSEGKRPDG